MNLKHRIALGTVGAGVALVALLLLVVSRASLYRMHDFADNRMHGLGSRIGTFFLAPIPSLPLADPASMRREIEARIARVGQQPLQLRERLARLTLIDGPAPTLLGDDDEAAFLGRFVGGRIAAGADAIEVFSVVHYGGVEHNGVLVSAPGSRHDRLLIYHQGHRGNPFDFPYFRELVTRAGEAGVDVLALAMTRRGFNSTAAISFPTKDGEARIAAGIGHHVFKPFHDPAYPDATGAALMLSGNHHIIRHVLARHPYRFIAMTGVSGGGWQTTVLSALIPEIGLSISFGGTVPLGFKIRKRDIGDYEQFDDPLYKTFDYWEFYALAAIDAAGRPTRRHMQVFNSHDPCCFDGGTARVLQEMLQQAGGIKGMSVQIVDSIFHMPNLDLLQKQVLERR